MKGYTIQHSIDLLEKAVENSGGGSGGGGTAVDVSYSNTSSGLVATNVQAAIDELDTNIEAVGASVPTISDYGENYTSSEIRVGTWLDNAPVYRRCLTLDSALTISNSEWTPTPFDKTGIDKILDCRCIRSESGGVVQLAANSLVSGDYMSVISAMNVVSQSFGIGSILIVTYTKTAPTRTSKKK